MNTLTCGVCGRSKAPYALVCVKCVDARGYNICKCGKRILKIMSKCIDCKKEEKQ